LRSEPIDKDPKLAAILGLLGGLIIGYWYIGLLKRGIVVTLLMLLSWFTVIGGVIVYAVGVYDIYKLSKNEPAPFDILNKWNLG